MADEPAKKKGGSAEKRARQNEKRRLRNAAVKSALKTISKRFLAAVQSGAPEEAGTAYLETVKAYDKAVSKNVIHANKAARKKSRYAHQLAEMGKDGAAKTA